MKYLYLITALLVSINSFSQTEIGGFKIVTQEQKAEIEAAQELKKFAALVDYVVKESNLPIPEDEIRFVLYKEYFTCFLTYSDFDIWVTYRRQEATGSFSLGSNSINIKKTMLYRELSDKYSLAYMSEPREYSNRYYFDFKSSVFSYAKVEKLLEGYSNENYIGTTALLLKRQKLNTDTGEKAQYENGEKYFRGTGQIQNYLKAFNYFKAAASLGNTDAYLRISEIFNSTDKGVHQDLEESIKWAQKALDLGNTEAYRQLGDIYLFKREVQTAINYYESGLEKGDVGSMMALYTMYRDGNSKIPKNPSKTRELKRMICNTLQTRGIKGSSWCD